MKKHSILIYGAGAIGSIYAVMFSNAGYDVTVYARSARLMDLQSKGLLYDNNGTTKKAPVTITDKVDASDIYDYVFTTVRYEQIETALVELANNQSKNIVTMVNTPSGYSHWENIVGKDRIIPAFAGAGGRIDNGVLYYQLTPKIVQPTTFGEISGKNTERLKDLVKIFKTSKVPCSVSKNMEAWQKSHLAMVVPLASGIYYDGGDNYTTAKNKKAIRMMSVALKENFNALKKINVPITPSKLNVFWLCPLWLMDFSLRLMYNTKFAETVIYYHAHIAKNEMQLLGKDFDKLVGRK